MHETWVWYQNGKTASLGFNLHWLKFEKDQNSMFNSLQSFQFKKTHSIALQQMPCKLEPFTISVGAITKATNKKLEQSGTTAFDWHIPLCAYSHNYVIHVIDNNIKIRLIHCAIALDLLGLMSQNAADGSYNYKRNSHNVFHREIFVIEQIITASYQILASINTIQNMCVCIVLTNDWMVENTSINLFWVHLSFDLACDMGFVGVRSMPAKEQSACRDVIDSIRIWVTIARRVRLLENGAVGGWVLFALRVQSEPAVTDSVTTTTYTY